VKGNVLRAPAMRPVVMRSSMTRAPGRAAHPAAMVAASFAAATLLNACAVRQDAAPVVGVDVKPSAPCDDRAAVPQMIETRAATLPSSVWDRKLGWDVRLTFRVDESGVPYTIRASVRGLDGDEDSDAIQRASAAAFAGYRFCRPVAYRVSTQWSARMRFRYVKVGAVFGGGEMYRQLFLPAYTRDDVLEQRAGRVVVRGIFEQDGRPTTLQVMTSSGDPVLDRKSLEAMASDQIVFRPGTMLTRPLFFAQPYVYEIR